MTLKEQAAAAIVGNPPNPLKQPSVTGVIDVFGTADAQIAGLTGRLNQLEALVTNGKPKARVRFVSTSTGTLATAFVNGTTHDGVTAQTGDAFLMVGRTDGAENGIRIVPASGAPTRRSDADADDEFVGAYTYVTDGTEYAGTLWRCLNTTPPDVGTDPILWDIFGGDDPGLAADVSAAMAAIAAIEASDTAAADGAESVAARLARDFGGIENELLPARDGLSALNPRLLRDYAEHRLATDTAMVDAQPPREINQGFDDDGIVPLVKNDATGQVYLGIDTANENALVAPAWNPIGFVHRAPNAGLTDDARYWQSDVNSNGFLEIGEHGVLRVASVDPVLATPSDSGGAPAWTSAGDIKTYDATGEITIAAPAGVNYLHVAPNAHGFSAIWDRPSVGATTRVRVNRTGDFAMPDDPRVVFVPPQVGHSGGSGSNGTGPFDDIVNVFTERHRTRLLMPDVGPNSEVRCGRPTGLSNSTPAFDASQIVGLRRAESLRPIVAPATGQTDAETMAVCLWEDAVEELGFAPRFVLANFAIGGCGLDEFAATPTTHYTSFVDGITRIAEVITDAGYVPYIPAVIANFGAPDNTDASAYTKLVALQAALETSLKSATGQVGDIPWIMDYPCEWATGQWEMINAINAAAVAYPAKFIPSHPIYHLPHATDQTHRAGVSYRVGGEYFKRALKRLLSGRRHEVIRPATVTRSGDTITAVFQGDRVGSLQFDADLSNRSGTYAGFQFFRNSGELEIGAHTWVNATTLDLVLSAGDPGAAGTERLDYAMLGHVATNPRLAAERPRGLLHDSSSEPSKYDPPRTLYNWCAPFTFAL